MLFRIEGAWKTRCRTRPTARTASSTDPATWSSFDEVVTAYEAGGFDGIGFVFTKGDPYCGIDLDDCRDPSRVRSRPWAQAIIDELASYTEVSPSGTGVHIIVRRQGARRRASARASRSTAASATSR